jgi:predicted DNA-binding ribbon-helix-helix protein
MKEISGARSMTLSQLVSEIDANRNQGNNLSSAIRQFVLDHFKSPCRSADWRLQAAR